MRRTGGRGCYGGAALGAKGCVWPLFLGCMAVAVAAAIATAVAVIVRMVPVAPPLSLALCVFAALFMIPFRRM